MVFWYRIVNRNVLASEVNLRNYVKQSRAIVAQCAEVQIAECSMYLLFKFQAVTNHSALQQ